MDIRTGFGYDIHRLISRKDNGDKPFLLAGVDIKGDYCVSSHSDGDIVFHALSNAILSGLGLEDIGYFFPDNAASTKDMNSLDILHFALGKMEERGYHLSNVVVDILLERPKLNPHRQEILQSLAASLNLPLERVGLSFNTGEKIGEVGTSQAVVVYSNVLLLKD